MRIAFKHCANEFVGEILRAPLRRSALAPPRPMFQFNVAYWPYSAEAGQDNIWPTRQIRELSRTPRKTKYVRRIVGPPTNRRLAALCESGWRHIMRMAGGDL